MNRIEIKARAKSAVKNNLGISIIAIIVYEVVVGVLASTGIGGLAVGLVTLALCAGFLKMLIEGTVQFDDFIKAITENVGTKFVATLLVPIYTFLWSLLFVIPGIVKYYSYAMTNYILMDRPELSASEAIAESRKMMNGHKMELFILDLSFIGWQILSIFTCGLLLLWVYPYMYAARAAFYLELKGPEETVTIENPEIVTPE